MYVFVPYFASGFFFSDDAVQVRMDSSCRGTNSGYFQLKKPQQETDTIRNTHAKSSDDAAWLAAELLSRTDLPDR